MEKHPAKRGNLSLVGFMGSGKSTVGPLLASRLGMSFVDLDDSVAAEAGMGIEEIFSREGETGFRARESEALRREMQGEGKVIACGGGIVLKEENVRLLRAGSLVFYLRMGVDAAVARLRGGEGRPLLRGGVLRERAEELMAAREERYREAAHFEVEVEGRDPGEIAEEIEEIWKRQPILKRSP